MPETVTLAEIKLDMSQVLSELQRFEQKATSSSMIVKKDMDQSVNSVLRDVTGNLNTAGIGMGAFGAKISFAQKIMDGMSKQIVLTSGGLRVFENDMKRVEAATVKAAGSMEAAKIAMANMQALGGTGFLGTGLAGAGLAAKGAAAGEEAGLASAAAGVSVGVLSAAAAAAAALAIGYADIAKHAVDAADRTDLFVKQVQTLTGSAKTAQTILDEVNTASLKSPFARDQLESAALTLAKFGLSIHDTLPMIQNMSAATGKDLGEAAEVAGRALQGNANAVLQLNKQFGLSIPELKNAGIEMGHLHRGSALTQEQIESLGKALETHFSGGAARKLDTYQGKIAAMKNEWELVSVAIGQKLLPLLNKALDTLKPIGDWFYNNRDYIANLFVDVAKAASTALLPLKAIVFVLQSILNAGAAVAEVLGHLSVGDFKGAVGGVADYFQGKTGLAGSEGIQTTTSGGKGDVRTAPFGEDTGAAAAEKKKEEANEEAEKTIQEAHAATVEKEIEEDLKYIAASELGSAKQKQHIQELHALEDERDAAALKAIDEEIDKLRKKGVTEDKLAALRSEAEQKLHEQRVKAIDEIEKIEQEQQKKELERLKQIGEERIREARKAVEEAEKQKIKDLNELLKEQEVHQKDIHEAINEQNKALDEQKKKIEDAMKEYQKGPLIGLKELGTTGFGARSFTPGTGTPEAPSLTGLISAQEQQRAQLTSQYPGLKDIAGDLTSDQIKQMLATPELAKGEEGIAGTKTQIAGEQQKLQQLQDIKITINAQDYSNDKELQDAVQKVLDKTMSKNANQANWKPQDSGIY
jgi:hypothetical protein